MRTVVGVNSMVVVLLLASCSLGRAQALPPVILEIDFENFVQYYEDTFDVTKFATNPNRTPAVVPLNFASVVGIADIVAVNGQPAKGTVTLFSRRLNMTPAANPGQAIGDTVRQSVINEDFEIQSANGNPIGTIIGLGLGGAGAPPPGSPSTQVQGNQAIVGGTGAFVGARGSTGGGTAANALAARTASIVEDPVNRRRNGGGRARQILVVIPASRPQIVATPNGPAVTHSNDFTLVSSSKPAAAGEVLSLFATDLGPTTPGVDPGKAFPSTPLAAVNSPVTVTVNGESAEVLAAIGFPGAANGYRVNFRVPVDTTPGVATIQVSAAWIAGPAVTISVR